MALKLITPPEGELITVAEAKEFMRVDHSDDDSLIDALITAARQRIEGPDGRLNAVFLEQTWDLILDAFPAREIYIPLAPVRLITEVAYFDTDGDEQTVSSVDYYLDSVSRPPWLIAVSDFTWPDTLDAANALRVRFVAGYEPGASGGSGDNEIADNVPAVVKLAAKQLVSHWYERRDMVVETPTLSETPEFVWQLLQPHRMFL